MPDEKINLPANLSNLRKQLQAYKMTAPRVRGSGSFLQFSKGDWTYGRERKAFDLSTVWIVHPESFEHGYICWRDGSIFHERLMPIAATLPAETSLPEPPAPKEGSDDQEGYQYQMGFTCVCVDGSLKGDQTTFKSGTVGGVGVMQKLLDDFDARLEEAEATGNPRVYPVVQFGTDHYMHKKRGKIMVPTITIVGFSSNDPNDEIEWLDAEEEEAAAPPPPPEPKVTKLRRTAR